jgi:hypothetical protein
MVLSQRPGKQGSFAIRPSPQGFRKRIDRAGGTFSLFSPYSGSHLFLMAIHAKIVTLPGYVFSTPCATGTNRIACRADQFRVCNGRGLVENNSLSPCERVVSLSCIARVGAGAKPHGGCVPSHDSSSRPDPGRSRCVDTLVTRTRTTTRRFLFGKRYSMLRC